MNVKRANPSSTTVLEILDESGDTINVIMFDYAPSKGKIIIEDYCQSWAAYWGGMRGLTVAEYIPDSNPNTLAHKLLPPQVDTQAIDVDELNSLLLKGVNKIYNLSKAERESLVFDIEEFGIPDLSEEESEEWVENNHETLFNLLGDDYYSKIPKKESLALTQLEGLVRKVQKALCIYNKNKEH